MKGTLIRVLAVATLALGLGSGCTGSDEPTVLVVDQPVALADTELHLSVTGVDPGERVEVSAAVEDLTGQPWRSSATFIASPQGTVELTDQPPVEGSYREADPMGLFWSMQGPGDTLYLPYPEEADGYDVVLEAKPQHGDPARATVRRLWLAPGTTHRAVDLPAEGVIGMRYEPAGQGHGGVLLLGGSEGGIGARYQAALLASHGYTALSLAYFRAPGLPATLTDVPIEYLAKGAGLLPAPVRVVGYSRGAEAALLLSGCYPNLVHGTVAAAPPDRVYPSPGAGGNAWTYQGRPLTAIPFERITGPVLAIGGTDDRLWPSGAMAGHVAQLTHGQLVVGPDAGHLVGGPAYLPSASSLTVNGETVRLGGFAAADAKIRREGWTRILDLLESTSTD